MGCDIHFHTEVKVNGRWEHYSNPRFSRSYNLFSLLAGVREVDDPMFKPFKKADYNLPNDMNIITRKLVNVDEGLHSLCCYNSQEISDFYKYLEENKITLKNIRYQKEEPLKFLLEWDYIGYLDGNSWDIIRYCNVHPKWIEDVRWIFGFDN